MQRFYRWALPAIALTALLTPSLHAVIPGAPEVRVTDLIAILFVGILIVSRRSGHAVTWGLPQVLLLVSFVAGTASLLAGDLIGYPPSGGDLRVVGRFLVYAALFTLVSSAVAEHRFNADRLLRWLSIGCVGLAVVVIQQYWNLFGLNQHYLNAIAPTHFVTFGNFLDSGRPVGMTEGPNELGFMCALVALCMLHAAITRRRVWYLAMFLVASFLVVLSGSRGGAVGLAVGVSAYAVVSTWTVVRRGQGRPLVVLTLVALLVGAALFVFRASTTSYSGLSARFGTLADPSQDPDFVARERQWRLNEQLFAKSPLVGVGPQTATTGGGDNEWLFLLRSYGVIGTLVIVAAVVSAVRGGATRDRILGVAALPAAAVFMIPGGVIGTISLMPLFIVVLGAFGARQPVRILAGDRVQSVDFRRPIQSAS